MRAWITRLLTLSVFILTFSISGIQAKTVSRMVVFGDSLSDNGNVYHMLRSIQLDEDPSYLVGPMETFIFRMMDDYARDYWIPKSVLWAGKKAVQQFFDIELSPMLASVLSTAKSIPPFPEEPYYKHHFSNGKIWNEFVAAGFGLNTKDLDEYYNQAFGGSFAATYDHQLSAWYLIRHPILSVEHVVQGRVVPPSLGLEVSGYLMNMAEATPDSLYFIYSGSNDYSNMLAFDDNRKPKRIKDYVGYVVEGITYSSEKLIEAGATDLVILGIPNLAMTPKFNHSEDKTIISEVTRLHNDELARAVTQLQANNPNVQITYIDTREIVDKLAAESERYGIVNMEDPCIDIPLPGYAFTRFSVDHQTFGDNFIFEYMKLMKKAFKAGYKQCAEPNTYAFFDILHPSETVHKALADEILVRLQRQGYETI